MMVKQNSTLEVKEAFALKSVSRIELRVPKKAVLDLW